jgi:hypothetical protein
MERHFPTKETSLVATAWSRRARRWRAPARTTFDNFVIDRLHAPDGAQRIYLRPKVPFGADRA